MGQTGIEQKMPFHGKEGFRSSSSGFWSLSKKALTAQSYLQGIIINSSGHLHSEILRIRTTSETNFKLTN